MEDKLVYEMVGDTLLIKSGKRIPNGFFNSDERFKKVVFNNGLEEIGEKAFSVCYIEEVEIPSSVKVIGNVAFYGNHHLKKVKLNEGLEEIDGDAFGGCDIEEVEIPSSVNEIGKWAFYRNTRLKKVYLYEDSPISKLSEEKLYYIFGSLPEIIIKLRFELPSKEEFQDKLKNVSVLERERLSKELLDLVSNDSYVEDKEHLDKVKDLLLSGADTEVVDSKGNTGLMISIKKNMLTTFKLYLLAKSDINHKNRLGDNPLILCSRVGNNEMADILIENDCIINGMNRLDESALSIARSNNNSYLVNLLENLLCVRTDRVEDRVRRILSL